MNEALNNYLEADQALWDHIARFESAEIKEGKLVWKHGEIATVEDLKKTVALANEAKRLKDIWLHRDEDYGS